MRIEERITFFVNEANDLQHQIKAIEAQIVVLQQRRETLIFSYHRVDGALSAVTEIKKDADKEVDPTIPQYEKIEDI